MPISPGKYKTTPSRKWQGVRVRSLRDMQNGWAALPAGTQFTIEEKHRGFSLRADACECCGLQARISKVQPFDLEILED